MRHTHQATPSESVEWPLAESAQASHRPSSAGDDDLSSRLYSPQVLAESIMELADPHFALGLM
ncbi:MAG TPA: hypothetical protein VGC63_11250 [Solirubrobacterales bacterium]